MTTRPERLRERPSGQPVLFPSIAPDHHGWLDVTDGHRLYWESCGNPEGVPLVYLHGGPGYATSPINRRVFDPTFYRIILLHQRGCGLSEPHGDCQANTTWHLVADLERLRSHLRIKRWVLAGGSWGTCLALAYGESHPDRCIGFRLRGVFLGRDIELDWWWNRTRMLFPDAYEEMAAAVPTEERADLLTALHVRLMNDDPSVWRPAAAALKEFSGRTVVARPEHARQAEVEDPRITLPLARFFVHYSINRFFLKEDQLLCDLHRIEHLPCAIVQGRYDVTTPMDSAWRLHRRWHGSALTIVEEAAHDELEPATLAALLAAQEWLKRAIRQSC